MIITGPTSSKEVYGEVPGGLIDGVNALFNVSLAIRPGSERVFLNGVRQEAVADYTVSPPTALTFVLTPLTGDEILVDYLR